MAARVKSENTNRRRADLLLAAVAAMLIFAFPAGGGAGSPSLVFVGGAQTVGGSCILAETAVSRFAVDCGIFGPPNAPLPPRPETLDFLILTHAHLDHCGRLPELVEAGFAGPVFCTAPTADLTGVMLRMSGNLSRGAGRKEAIKRTIELLTPVRFASSFVAGGCRFRFVRAGHLLGAASIVAGLPANGDTVVVVFSGDIGGDNLLLAPPHGSIGAADYVVMESTYGGSVREAGANEARRRFAREVGRTLERGGDVLVPAFTLGKTQEVIAAIQEAMDRKEIPPGTIVWSDSPTARSITAIYRRYPDALSPYARSLRGRLLSFPSLREVKSRTTMAVHARLHEPAVFVTSSGDLEYANSPRHLARMIDDETNLLCLVGWCSPGSLGARLRNGESPVMVVRREGGKTKREWMTPTMRIASFECFSGHADREGLTRWLDRIGNVRRVFLVHGEMGEASVLADTLRRRGVDTAIPRAGERFKLDPPRRAGQAGSIGPAAEGRGGA